MRTLCTACRAGPTGVEGHEHLRARILGDGWIAFDCDGCHALWSRITKPQRHTWARLPQRHRLSGVHIPQRRDAAF